VRGTGADGSTTESVTPGFSGQLTTSVNGLVPALEGTADLSGATGGGFPTASPAAGPHTAMFTVTVPAGTPYVRFATFDADVAPGTDLDVYVFRGGTNTLVAKSTGDTASEWVSVTNPTATSYDVYVDLFAGPDQTIREDSWVLGGDAGNLSVSPNPAPVTVGQPAALTAAWTGLDPAQRYLARLSYTDGTTSGPTTLVWVNAPAA